MDQLRLLGALSQGQPGAELEQADLFSDLAGGLDLGRETFGAGRPDLSLDGGGLGLPGGLDSPFADGSDKSREGAEAATPTGSLVGSEWSGSTSWSDRQDSSGGQSISGSESYSDAEHSMTIQTSHSNGVTTQTVTHTDKKTGVITTESSTTNEETGETTTTSSTWGGTATGQASGSGSGSTATGQGSESGSGSTATGQGSEGESGGATTATNDDAADTTPAKAGANDTGTAGIPSQDDGFVPPSEVDRATQAAALQASLMDPGTEQTTAPSDPEMLWARLAGGLTGLDPLIQPSESGTDSPFGTTGGPLTGTTGVGGLIQWELDDLLPDLKDTEQTGWGSGDGRFGR